MVQSKSFIYSYKRYNGILENFPSSNRLLEIQMMQRFFNEFRLYSGIIDKPSKAYPELQEIYKANIDPPLRGSLHATTNHVLIYIQ